MSLNLYLNSFLTEHLLVLEIVPGTLEAAVNKTDSDRS